MGGTPIRSMCPAAITIKAQRYCHRPLFIVTNEFREHTLIVLGFAPLSTDKTKTNAILAMQEANDARNKTQISQFRDLLPQWSIRSAIAG